MQSDFQTLLRVATNSVRQSDIAGATRVIQFALGLSHAGPQQRSKSNDFENSDAPTAVVQSRFVDVPKPAEKSERPRRKLADVVRFMQQADLNRLRQFRSPGTNYKPVITDPLPNGASFTDFSFACDEGKRNYKLYVPSAGPGLLRGLIIMLHGCTQNSADFSVGTCMNRLAHEFRLLVAYPEQASAANHLRCWNWFNPRDQQRDQGEPAIIARITKQIILRYEINPQHV